MEQPPIDLTPYLVEVFLASETIINPETTDMETHGFIKNVETWWKRHREEQIPVSSPVAHLLLALVNITTALMAEKLEGVDLFQQRNRLSMVKSQLIQHMATHLPQCEPKPAEQEAA